MNQLFKLTGSLILFIFLNGNAMGQTQIEDLPPPPTRKTLEGTHSKTEKFTDLDREPVPLNMQEFTNAVAYPNKAKAEEIIGKVIVRIKIDKKGRYVKHVILQDPNPILTNAVINKLPILRFSPAKQDGKRVEVWVTIPVNFQLN